jgi:ABC-2 type transport system ATP-binding protein
MNILSIKNLTKSFGDKKIINNLSFAIEQGKILGLVGPNGVGKTTIINCIVDLLDFEEGEIKIFMSNMKSDTISIKKRMGILFENNDDLFLKLKGEEHLQFVGEIYGLKSAAIEKRINELFNFFELNDDRNKIMEEYSKGMRKKIAFASVLLHDPEFIILDEPFDGLDTLTIIKIKKLLKQLKEKGKTILITSHILSYIEDLADEVAIINKGKIVFRSETKLIRSKIKNEITQETYKSLEEIFIDLTTEKEEEETLSWL